MVAAVQKLYKNGRKRSVNVVATPRRYHAYLRIQFKTFLLPDPKARYARQDSVITVMTAR
jgi:hypothetical protein